MKVMPFIIILINLLFLAQPSAWAQDYPVSIVETGKTKGFYPPTLHVRPSDLLPKLVDNRSLHEPYLINQDPDLGEVGAPIDFEFIATMIRNEVKAFNHLIDPYDNPAHPSPGYTWDMKIFHPGSTPGLLPPEGAPYPIIIFCNGATGSEPAYSSAMDWMGTYYAQKGYIFAIPVFIENDVHFDEKPFYEISTDIYSLQASTAIDFLQERFSRLNRYPKRLINTRHVTLFGYSLGGHVAQKTAAQDKRVSRLCLLSSVFIYYQSAWAGFLLDAKDTYDLLNACAKERGMALHVQRFTKPSHQSSCPDWDPECDWIPPVDGFLTRIDLSQDPWEPYLCEGEPCGVRDGTYYNYLLYEGPKEDEIKNNGLIDHAGLASPEPENDAGRELALQYLDEFFAQFPIE